MAGFHSSAAALLLGVFAVAACGGGAPPSDVAQGVGFQDYQTYQARRAALRGDTMRQPDTVALPGPQMHAALPPSTGPADAVAAREPGAAAASAAQPVTDVTRIAAAAIAEAEGAPAPVTPGIGAATVPSPALAQQATTAPGRVVVGGGAAGPTGETGSNIVDYALSTSHTVGERRYSRNPLGQALHGRNCAAFPSSDHAQDWFLRNGGPGRDRRSLDPDGDGFACDWDPAFYRVAVAPSRS